MVAPPPVVIGPDGIEIQVDLRVFRLIAVQKTAYRLADRCTAAFGVVEGDVLPVILRLAPSTTDDLARVLADAFLRELLDQELRERVGEETAPLRALILAHAFSRTGLIER